MRRRSPGWLRIALRESPERLDSDLPFLRVMQGRPLGVGAPRPLTPEAVGKALSEAFWWLETLDHRSGDCLDHLIDLIGAGYPLRQAALSLDDSTRGLFGWMVQRFVDGAVAFERELGLLPGATRLLAAAPEWFAATMDACFVRMAPVALARFDTTVDSQEAAVPEPAGRPGPRRVCRRRRFRGGSKGRGPRRR